MSKKHENLRDAILIEALTIIDHVGLEKLSMREVSRRLGVSHQAPYKHFANRDEILAEILTQAFTEFTQLLASYPEHATPEQALRHMAQAYLQFATQNPLKYRLMFGSTLPQPDQYTDMVEQAQGAFHTLRDAVARMGHENSDADALYIWSTMHGLSSILSMHVYDRLPVAEQALETIIEHVIMRIGTGIDV